MGKVCVIDELTYEDAIVVPLNSQTILIVLRKEALVEVEMRTIFLTFWIALILSINTVALFLTHYHFSKVYPFCFFIIYLFLIGKFLFF
jgi:hypothetical protein